MYSYVRILLSSGIAWLIAQVIKVIISACKKETKDIFVSGGMPSSHSAVVTALFTRVGLIEGFDSSIFAIGLIFAFITMFDAANVRMAVGRQAMRLNQIIRDIYNNDKEKAEPVKIVKGHTYAEVAVGLVLGIIVVLIFTFIEKKLGLFI